MKSIRKGPVFAGALLCATMAWAQTRGGGAGAGAGAGAGTGTRTPTTPSPSIPSRPDRNTPNNNDRLGVPELQRPMYLSGKVMMDDGTAPPEPVMLVRTCGSGQQIPEAYTDTKGSFNFEVGRNMTALADASMAGTNDPYSGANPNFPGNTSRTQSMGSPGTRSGTGMRGNRLMGCDLRASMPGYRSDVVNLGMRREFDNPDVGVIVLHRLGGGGEGTTVSATSLEAPSNAKKAYEKGLEAMRKNKPEDAVKQLEKATQIYPKYAAAWAALGQVYQQQKDLPAARNALNQSIASDARYVKPYLQLAVLNTQEQKWQEAADASAKVIRLNPLAFSEAYYYNSVAEFQLHHLDAAEQSARDAVKMDPEHHSPKIEHLLGVILANKHAYPEAAQLFRTYLEKVPDAPDAPLVKRQLAEVESMTKNSAPPAQQ